LQKAYLFEALEGCKGEIPATKTDVFVLVRNISN